MFDFLSKKFTDLFSKTPTSSTIDTFVTSIHEMLLEADVPLQVIRDFTNQVTIDLGEALKSKKLFTKEQWMKLVHEKIVYFLGGHENQKIAFMRPSILMVMGTQGSGKTTTVAKLAAYIQKSTPKSRILLASIDFYRPAAIDQLEVLAKTVQASFYRAKQNNSVHAALEIMAHYKEHGYDFLILDTAGRLHIDTGMISELQEVVRVIHPTQKILVLDGMTGQESLAIAKSFNESIGFQGAVLTKMDSDSRGGAAFAFRYALGKPIFFIGTGEKPHHLEQFFPDRIASRMIGSGDLKTLLERSQERIDKVDEKKMTDLLTSNTFTFNDYLSQIAMMERLGSLSSLVKYMPGMAGRLSDADMKRAEREVSVGKAIVSSMTKKERLNRSILNESRQKRIALGAGVSLNDVKLFLKRFDEVCQYVKMVKKAGGFGRLFRQ